MIMMREMARKRMLTNQVMISRSMSGVANEPLPWGEVMAIRIIPIGRPNRANFDHDLKTSGRRKERIQNKIRMLIENIIIGWPTLSASGASQYPNSAISASQRPNISGEAIKRPTSAKTKTIIIPIVIFFSMTHIVSLIVSII